MVAVKSGSVTGNRTGDEMPTPGGNRPAIVGLFAPPLTRSSLEQRRHLERLEPSPKRRGLLRARMPPARTTSSDDAAGTTGPIGTLPTLPASIASWQFADVPLAKCYKASMSMRRVEIALHFLPAQRMTSRRKCIGQETGFTALRSRSGGTKIAKT